MVSFKRDSVSNTFNIMRIVLLMGEVIKLVDALVQILCSFSVATFQYGLEKVQTTNRLVNAKQS